jgi:hypothetical protein
MVRNSLNLTKAFNAKRDGTQRDSVTWGTANPIKAVKANLPQRDHLPGRSAGFYRENQKDLSK